MSASEIQPLTEVEESLAEDNSGEGVKAMVNELAATESEVKKHIDSGLPPAEFKKAEAVLAALDTAKGIAAKTWADLNKD